MYDFGSANDHSNAILLSDLSALDAPTSYSMAFWLDWDAASSGTWAEIFSKWVATAGWIVRINPGTNNKLLVLHTSAAGTSTSITSDSNVGGSEESWVITWNGTQINLFRNGVPEASNPFAMTRTIGANAAQVCIGNRAALSLGFGGKIGHVMHWNGTVLSAGEAVQYHKGVIPQREFLTFWAKGTRLVGKDEIGGRVADDEGTVSLAAGACDGYYSSVAQTPIEIAGMELHRSRIEPRIYTVNVPIEFLDKEAMEDLLFVSDEGLEHSGVGFGLGDAPKRLVRITGIKPIDENTARLTLRDLSRYTTTFYDQLIAPTTIGEKQLGAFRVYPPGVSKTISRASSVWVEQAGGAIIQLFNNEEPLTLDGLLLEPQRKNEIVDPAFRGGVDGGSWTLVNEGVNGSTIEDDTNDLLFEAGVSPQSCKLTAGTPLGSSYVGVRQAITLASGASTRRHLSIDHKDDSGEVLSITIQRDSDSHYRTSLSADNWGASLTYLDLPLSDNVIGRWVDFVSIDPGIHSGIVYTVTIYAKAAAAQVNHVYHVQFEANAKYATSRIAASEYTRESTSFTINSPATARSFRLEKGTVFFHLHPLADIEFFEYPFGLVFFRYQDSSAQVFEIRFANDSNNYFEAKWYPGTDAYSIVPHPDWNAGDAIKVALRWLQPGDLGKAERQFQLFANFGSGWVEGSIGYPDTEYATGDGFISLSSGRYKYLKVLPEPLHLDEIKALP